MPIEISNTIVKVGFFPQDGYHDFKDGIPSGGYGYDFIQNLRQYAPVKYEYDSTESGWPAAFKMLEEGKIDMLSNVRKTPEREKKFAFSKHSMGRSSTILTVKSGNNRYRVGDYANWNGMHIGSLQNSVAGTKLSYFAKSKGFSYKISEFENTKEMLKALADGRIDAVLSNNLRRLRNEWVLEQLDIEPFFIVVRKDNRQLLAQLNSAMEQLELDNPALRDILWKKYFVREQSESVLYKESERMFISQMRERKHKFTAVLNPDRYPISYYKDGKNLGFIKEIADEIISRSGLAFDFLPVKTPEEYRAACKNPKTDIVFDVKYDLTEAENIGLILSKPYISLSAFMLRNKKTGNDIKNIVLIEGYRISEKIRQILPDNVKIGYCKTTDEAISLVKSGKFDATCLHTSAAEYAVRNDPADRFVATLLPRLRINLAVGTRDTLNENFSTIINKSVASLSEDFVAQIVLKYKCPINTNFSFQRALHTYPIIVLGVPLTLLILICIFLIWTLRERNYAYRLGLVFKRLPFRYFFADKNCNLLEYNYGNEIEYPDFKNLDDLKDDNVRIPMKKLVSDAIESGETQQDMYIDEGKTRIATVTSIPHSIFGRPAVIGISRDITELQKTRAEAHKNEEYFRLTLNSIGDGVIATDMRGKIVMINPVAERMIGVKFEEAKGKAHTDFFKIKSSFDGSELESPILRTLRTGGVVELANHTDLISLDGKSHYHIADSSSPILNEDGKIIGAILVFRDVSEEYERRKEIQAEVANWEAAARIAQIYHFIYDSKTQKILGGSKRISDVWPIVDGKAVSGDKWIHPDDYSEWNKKFHAIVEGKSTEAVTEYRAIQNGKIRYFRGYMYGTGEPNGKITGMVQDITQFIEEKKKQDSMRSLWATCLETMPITLFIKEADNEFRYQQCNSNFAKCAGLEMKDIIGKNDAELFSRHKDIECFVKTDSEVMNGWKAVEIHESMLASDGKIHHYSTIKVPSIGIDGRPILLGMSFDETDDVERRHQIDNILEDWENIAKVARITSYRLSRDMRVIRAGDWVSEFWPVLNGVPASAEEYLHPDDVAAYNEMYDSVFSGKEQQASMLCRVPDRNGIRYLRLFIKQAKDNPDEVSGLMQDVTSTVREQKKREVLLSMWKNVVDTLPALFFVKNADDDFRYMQVNGKFYDQLGMNYQDIIGKTEEEFLPNPADAKNSRAEDIMVMDSGKPMDFIEKIQIKDGSIRQYETVKIPSVDEFGRRILIAMSKDITDVQEIEKSRKIIMSAFETLFTSDNLEKDMRVILRNICEFIGFERAYIGYVDEAENQLRIFTSYYNDGLQPIVDIKNFRIERANTLPRYIKIAESVRNDVYRFDFADPHDLDLAKLHVPTILEKAKEFDLRGVHINYISLNGKVWGCIGFITSGHSLKKLSDNETKLLKLVSHIVELAVTRKRTMEQLQNALANALSADKAKNYFLSSMSHEIRTPLNAVIGFTDLLKDSELDEATRNEYLDAVTESSHALLTLLNDILELSKLASGKIKSDSVHTDIKAFVSELEIMFSVAAAQKKLNLRFEIGDVPYIYIDQSKLRQILLNLVGNAIKFTEEGGVTVAIKFDKNGEDYGNLVIKVSDTGIGIPPEYREKIFEPFIRMSRMRGTNASGNDTGLGLAIVKKTVEQEGGELNIESELGKGSTFTIFWPKVRLHPTVETDTDVFVE